MKIKVNDQSVVALGAGPIAYSVLCDIAGIDQKAMPSIVWTTPYSHGELQYGQPLEVYEDMHVIVVESPRA